MLALGVGCSVTVGIIVMPNTGACQDTILLVCCSVGARMLGTPNSGARKGAILFGIKVRRAANIKLGGRKTAIGLSSLASRVWVSSFCLSFCD